MAAINQIQLRRGTKSSWETSNPTLTAGEPGYVSDLNIIKIGDGTTAWNDLDYLASEAFSLVTTVFNNTGSSISELSAVYINGGQGDQPTVALAQANSESASSKTYGITAEAIPNMSTGKVIVSGALTQANTDQFNPTAPSGNVNGTTLWLSATVAGGLTTTKPSAPNHMVAMGTIVRTHQNQGIVEVKVQNGFELQELHNVSLNGITGGEFLSYNGVTSLWIANPNLFSSGSNIGIGTSTPTSALQVTGLITANSGTFGNLLLSSNTLSSAAGNIIISPSASGSLQRDSGGDTRGIYAVDWQSVRSTGTMVAAGTHSVICGGQNNSASGTRSVVCGGTNNNAAGTVSSIGGGNTNSCIGVRSTIGGGTLNSANAENATIGGGGNNSVSGLNGTIGGGSFNNTIGAGSTIAGGANNSSTGEGSTIGGGNSNTSAALRSTVVGGSNNTTAGRYSTVIGGDGAKTTKPYEVAHAAGVFASAGDIQHSILIAKVLTTGISPTNLFTEVSGDRLTIPADKTTWTFTAKISAYNDTDNLGAGWNIQGCIQRYNNLTTLIGTNVVNQWVPTGMNGVTASASAASANNALTIQVIGLANKNIRWVCVVDISQVSWGVI